MTAIHRTNVTATIGDQTVDAELHTDETHTFTAREWWDRIARIQRAPGEIWIDGNPWGTITGTVHDRQTPALPRIHWS